MAMFGYRRPDQIGAAYSPTRRSVVDTAAPSPVTTPPRTADPRPRGLFGKIGHSLNAFDDDPTFGDWLLGGMDRMDDLRDRKIKGQQQAQAQAQMEDFISQLSPEYQSFARQFPEQMAKIIGKGLEPQPDEFDFKDGALFNKRRQSQPEDFRQVTPQVRRPLVTAPGSEVLDYDEVTGLPRIDPKTNLPIVLYRNRNFAPKASGGPTMPPPGFQVD